MNCPVCDAELQEVQRSGVSIDVCPRCRGVWLDRGELEKILDAEAGGSARFPAPAGIAQRRREHDDEHHGYRGHDDDHDDDERYGGRRRRRGFLGGIFDSLGGDD